MIFFGRFHIREGQETAMAAAIADVLPPSRAEPGCIAIDAFRGLRDPRLFYIHSRWVDEAAFDLHASLAHTVRFIERAQALIDRPAEFTRTQSIDGVASDDA